MVNDVLEKPGARATIFVETYGCQMNVLDTELVTGQLELLGYGFVTQPEAADIVLINTCSVRALAEQKVWSLLGRLGLAKRRRDGDLIIGVLGCMAEREGPKILKRMPHVDIVCGPSNLDRLAGLIDNVRHQRGTQVALSGHTSRRSATLEAATDGVETLDLSRAFSPTSGGRFQAYVRITRGCNKFCAFCVVPYTRGPEVHRPPQHIVDEVRRLVDGGAREVTLLGQTINHYAFQQGEHTTSFADLLALVHDQVPELPRLRFLTSYPRDFSDEALDVMAASPRICRFLHIPAQSGSNALLRKMNRGYTVEAYLDLVQRARARMPDISLSGDMIVGFPGETDADHQASIALLRAAAYKSCYVFKYSPRPGTVAERRLVDDVPEELKRARNLELLDVQAEISLAHHRRYLGKVLPVFVEGHHRLRQSPPAADGNVRLAWQERRHPEAVRLVGRTGGDEIVAFDGPPHLIGQITWVRALSATPLSLLAAWQDPSLGLSAPAAASQAAPGEPTWSGVEPAAVV